MKRHYRFLAAGILSSVSILFLMAGGIMAFWMPHRMTQDIERLATLPVSASEQFQGVGETVIVEGMIADRNESSSAPFLIYNEYQRVFKKGTATWELQTSHTPEFWLTAENRLIKVKGDYHLEKVRHEIQSGDRRLEGLQIADPVLVAGTTTALDDPPTLDADIVTADTRDRYLADLRSQRVTLREFGVLLLVIGVLLTGRATAIARHLRP